jgi:hypothetical protein
MLEYADNKIDLNAICPIRMWARCTYISLHVVHILGIYLGDLLFDFMFSWVKLLLKLYSFPSALQLRVSFGLLNNLPPFFSILHLSSPPFRFHFTDIIMYVLQPS